MGCAYSLPQGNVQISFSGGRTSAYMLHQIAQANGGIPNRCKVIFSNTGREMPETLDFVQECSVRWSIPIVWVEDAERGGIFLFNEVSHSSASRDGKPFERLIERKKACPDQSKRFCTEHLKILPARRYLISIGWRNWCNATGIRADEASRANVSTDKRVTRWFPLIDAKVTKSKVLQWWASQSFDLRVPAGFGNCDGCFMKSEAQLAALCREYPERAEWWDSMERKATALTKSANGARFRDQFTRSELKKVVDRQGDFFVDDFYCNAEHGECQ